MGKKEKKTFFLNNVGPNLFLLASFFPFITRCLNFPVPELLSYFDRLFSRLLVALGYIKNNCSTC